MSADMVNHPPHYNSGKIEVIEFLEDQFMNRPHEWTATKYLCRADKKGREVEDLEKAIWYIKRKIELLKAVKEQRGPIKPDLMNSFGSQLAPPPSKGAAPYDQPVGYVALGHWENIAFTPNVDTLVFIPTSAEYLRDRVKFNVEQTITVWP